MIYTSPTKIFEFIPAHALRHPDCNLAIPSPEKRKLARIVWERVAVIGHEENLQPEPE